MAIKKTDKKELINYSINVERAKKVAETSKGGDIILFDAVVNGVSISNMKATEYENSNGDVDFIIDFPKRKGKNKEGEEAYYNSVFFPISRDMRKFIISAITSFISET